MVTENMVAKIKEIQAQAKAVDVACVTLLENPNLNDVIQMATLLEQFVTGKPPVAPQTGAKRTRRTRAQIEAEQAALAAGSKG